MLSNYNPSDPVEPTLEVVAAPPKESEEVIGLEGSLEGLEEVATPLEDREGVHIIHVELDSIRSTGDL